MAYEKSVGAVIFNQNGVEIEYLILNYPAGHWDFPKGNVEEGETEENTAKREVAEETGITNITILPSFRKKIQYYYRQEHVTVRKEVIFYLARSPTKHIQLSNEHTNYAWLNYTDVIRKLTYTNSKSILKSAQLHLEKMD